MKKLTGGALFLISLFMVSGTHAQGFLDKLKKFAGNEDTLGVQQDIIRYVIEGPGTVTLPGGALMSGTVSLVVSNNEDSMKYVTFIPENEMKPMRMWSDDVAYVTVKGRSFLPVRMKEDDLSIGHKTIFMEMLNNSRDDKFKMYRFRKLERNEMSSGAKDKPYLLHRAFYVMLPDFKNAHEIVDMTFSPFASKMSGYLKDCPELAKKIEDKEKGYRYNMFKGAENDEVFFRVMQEYNSCGKL
jgi:hypothetical protein